jgi:hypothetical protein
LIAIGAGRGAVAAAAAVVAGVATGGKASRGGLFGRLIMAREESCCDDSCGDDKGLFKPEDFGGAEGVGLVTTEDVPTSTPVVEVSGLVLEDDDGGNMDGDDECIVGRSNFDRVAIESEGSSEVAGAGEEEEVCVAMTGGSANDTLAGRRGAGLLITVGACLGISGGG